MKRFLFKTLRYSGLPFLFRQYVHRRRVSIVLMHDICPDTAEAAFTLLKQYYNIISLRQYLQARQDDSADSLPDRSLIITLDDGHIRNYELLPVIKRLRIPITIFLCAGIVDTRRHFWFNYEHPTLSTEELKQLPTPEKLAQLAVTGFDPMREYDRPQALTAAQIEEMKPYVDFQAHTVFHPILPQCSDEKAAFEIHQGKKILEEKFGLDINALAFPNGDYTERAINLTKKAGYECALTVDPGSNAHDEDLFRLKRFGLNDHYDVDEILVKSSGVWDALKGLLKRDKIERDSPEFTFAPPHAANRHHENTLR